jgi:hydrogenase-4 component F
MLAYSSIEHMGLMAIGVAIGPAALPSVLLYILGHGLIKATLFVISGRILQVEGTPVISDVRALLVRRPGLAIPWLIAMAAIVGFPPFSIFFSEIGIIMAGWSVGLGGVVAAALVLLLVIFAAFTRLTVQMTMGAPPEDAAFTPDYSAHGPRLPIILALATTATVVFVAEPVGTLLLQATAVLGGIN